MPPPIAASDVFIGEDLGRIFDALEVARPDLGEALEIIRIAIGLRSAASRLDPYTTTRPHTVDGQWRVTR